MCEAISHDYQLFRVDCNYFHDFNIFTSLTVAYCGMNNQGNSAFGICGESQYKIENLNSSYNFNYVNDKSFGACFRTYNIKGYSLSYYDFAHSTGHDIFNTHFYGLPDLGFSGTFTFGNVYNCTSDFISKFRGINYIQHSFFGLLKYSNNSFKCGASKPNGHLLKLTNCHFDIMPTDAYSPCEITFSQKENPFKTEVIYHTGIDMCPIPTNRFTQSQLFSMSLVFTPSSHFSPSKFFTLSDVFSSSSKFTSSKIFSPSSEFTKSNIFTDSSEFTRSNSFSPTYEKTNSPSSEFSPSNSILNVLPKSTSTFTQSSPFTPSFTFSPNATKYPDGLGHFERAEVSGKSVFDQPASAATVGATAGISFVIIGVSVFLMILYLRNKQRQLIENPLNFSDSFLYDSSDSQCSSYSYSYYTYEYTYVSYNDDEEDDEDYDYYQSAGTDYSYSCYSSYYDFEVTQLMLGEK